MPRTSLTIVALLPHVGVYGGVRRYVEMGNEMVARGHRFRILHRDGDAPAWIPYDGEVAPIERLAHERVDVAICGDTGLLDRLAEAPARLKIMNLLGSHFAEKYRRRLRSEFVVVGNASGWEAALPEVSGRTIAGGVNLERFYPLPRPPARPLRLLAFGRRRKARKGTDLVLRAHRALGRNAPGLILFDDRRAPLPWWARWRRIEWAVGVPQDEMAALYARGDVFVSAEWGAGWSNPTAEAMACGLAVVCTPSGTRDFAHHGETAWVVPPHDPDAIAGALRRLASDEGLRRRLARAGRAEIARFSWRHLCDGYESLFAEYGLLPPPSPRRADSPDTSDPSDVRAGRPGSGPRPAAPA